MLLLLAQYTPQVALAQPADAWAGKYQSEKLSLELKPNADGYLGDIHLGTSVFPLRARPADGELVGSFTSRGYEYGFKARLSGTQLTLTSGGKTYELQRQAEPPPNPLAETAPAQPSAAAPAGRRELPTNQPGANPAGKAPEGALEGYTVLATQESGRTLFILKTNVHSAKEAVLGTLHDLARLFDQKPAVAGGFGDANDRQCRGAFTAKLAGQPVKGTVTAGVGENGTAVSVVYCRANASPGELTNLMKPLSSSAEWVVHPLPGGSGTVKMPPGWTITQSSALGSVAASGPAGQLIGLGIGAEVLTPNSFLAPQARASGSLLVAPYSDPVTALKTLVPQLSLMSQRKGGPAIVLQNIISNSPAPPQIPNGQASWIYSAYLKGNGQNAIRVRELALLECYPVGPMGWGIYTSYASAPDTNFDEQLPVMLEIAKTWKLNDQAVTDNSRQMINAQNRNFAAFQQSMREKNAAFDRYMQSVRNSETVREKSNADFDEIIRGYRTVEDTSTGDRTDVDLGYSKEIVDKLNEKEGYQRYKEIPLRDQY